MEYRPLAPRRVPRHTSSRRAIAGARSIARKKKIPAGVSERPVDRAADHGAKRVLFRLSDAAAAIDSMPRYRRSLPSAPGKMRTRATTLTLVRRMLGILIAVLRRREPRNSQTPFPKFAALVP